MAYGGQGYMPLIGGRTYSEARFNDQNIANTFQKVLAQSGAPSLQAGQYFTGEGGTEYRTVTGIDPNQPGWGNRVPTGYELIGYQSPEMYTGRQRQLYGSTPKTPGFAILRKQGSGQPAPAAAPPPAPTQNLQIAKLTQESEAYRKQAEQTIAEGQARVAELENQELQRQRAAELQNRLAIQAQTSQARGAAQASLKIGAASDTSRTAGTAAFKRRRDQMRLAPIQTTAGINAPASSVLNV